MPRMITCPNCGESKRHWAKGLCRSCYDKKQNKEYYEKHRKHWISRNSISNQKRKKKRLELICKSLNIPSKCVWEDCNISNHVLLTVRHVNGRLPGEHKPNKVYIKKSWRITCLSIEQISEDIFQENLRNKNYMIFCKKHGHVYEWGTIAERLNNPTLTRAKTTHKYKIKRLVHRLSLLGGKCSFCGETNYNYLLAHHKSITGAKDCALISMPDKRFKELYEANELQCLCFNCHGLLHYRERNKNLNLLDYCIT